MKNYKVWAVRWSEEIGAQIKENIGDFNEYTMARLFAQAYADKYHAAVEIAEYKQIGTIDVSPTL